jgi:uncharacterized protein (TIGR03435 family)
VTNGPLGFRVNRSVWKLIVAAALLAAGAPIVLAQKSARPSTHAPAATPAAAAPVATTAASDPTLGIAFDVVSIKPSGPQSSYYGVRTLPEGDTLSADNFSVEDMVRWAYHLGHRWGEPEHPDVPKWYSTDHYDIRAKVAAEDVDKWHKLNEEGRRLVLRKVLAERFKLVCHFQDVDGPVYNLVIAKGGSKMTEAKPGEVSPYHFHSPGDPSMAYTGPGMTMRNTPNGPLTVFQRMDMAEFEKSDIFAYTLDRPVIDKTGLTGGYNFSLDFSWQPISGAPASEGVASEPTSPDIFTALEKQLGLKLEPGRGAIRQLIVDHVERPSED